MLSLTIKMDINESVKEYFKSLNGVKPLKRKEERNLLFEYHGAPVAEKSFISPFPVIFK